NDDVSDVVGHEPDWNQRHVLLGVAALPAYFVADADGGQQVSRYPSDSAGFGSGLDGDDTCFHLVEGGEEACVLCVRVCDCEVNERFGTHHSSPPSVDSAAMATYRVSRSAVPAASASGRVVRRTFA